MLKIKENWQVFPTTIRGIDFVGYRHFGNYILLRKSTAKNMKRKLKKINNKYKDNGVISYSDWCCINSYKGWLGWCNGRNLHTKYVRPLEKASKEYYYKTIKKGENYESSRFCLS
jgi:hypothetical protein